MALKEWSSIRSKCLMGSGCVLELLFLTLGLSPHTEVIEQGVNCVRQFLGRFLRVLRVQTPLVPSPIPERRSFAVWPRIALHLWRLRLCRHANSLRLLFSGSTARSTPVLVLLRMSTPNFAGFAHLTLLCPCHHPHALSTPPLATQIRMQKASSSPRRNATGELVYSLCYGIECARKKSMNQRVASLR
jgi:hypothetical protein